MLRIQKSGILSVRYLIFAHVKILTQCYPVLLFVRITPGLVLRAAHQESARRNLHKVLQLHRRTRAVVVGRPRGNGRSADDYAVPAYHYRIGVMAASHESVRVGDSPRKDYARYREDHRAPDIGVSRLRDDECCKGCVVSSGGGRCFYRIELPDNTCGQSSVLQIERRRLRHTAENDRRSRKVPNIRLCDALARLYVERYLAQYVAESKFDRRFAFGCVHGLGIQHVERILRRFVALPGHRYIVGTVRAVYRSRRYRACRGRPIGIVGHEIHIARLRVVERRAAIRRHCAGRNVRYRVFLVVCTCNDTVRQHCARFEHKDTHRIARSPAIAAVRRAGSGCALRRLSRGSRMPGYPCDETCRIACTVHYGIIVL